MTQQISNMNMMKRAAAVRSLILAYFNGHNDDKTIKDFMHDRKAELDAAGVDDPNTVQYQLAMLVKNNQLHSEKRGNVNYYSHASKRAGSVAVVKRAHKHAEPQPVHHAPPQHVPPPADLSIELVQSTGKLRIGIAGMKIEIGVTDK